MRLTAGLVFLAACGGGAAQHPIEHSGGGASPPELFRELFVANKTWSFPTEVVIGMDGQVTKTPGQMTCKVASTSHPTPDTWQSKIECDGGPDGNLGFDARPIGTFVANAKGLWHFDDAAGELTDKTMLIAAAPKAAVYENAVPDEPAVQDAFVAFKNGWCVSHMTNQGDADGHTLCFRGDVGLLGGAGFFAGGRSVDLYWGDAPRQ